MTDLPPTIGGKFPTGWELSSAGSLPEGLRTGDFGLVHQTLWTSRVISFGEALRLPKDQKHFAKWSHAFFVQNEAGDLIEALGHGVTNKTNISNYKDVDFFIVRTNLQGVDQARALACANSFVNEKYDFLEIASIALTLLTATKFSFLKQNTMICSGVVSASLFSAGFLFNKNPWLMIPSELGQVFGVEISPIYPYKLKPDK